MSYDPANFLREVPHAVDDIEIMCYCLQHVHYCCFWFCWKSPGKGYDDYQGKKE